MNRERTFIRRKKAQGSAKMKRAVMMRFTRNMAHDFFLHRRIFLRPLAPFCGPLVLR